MNFEWKVLIFMILAIVVFVITSMASYDSGYTAAQLEGKIVSKRMHSLTTNGPDAPFTVKYKLLIEKEVDEIVENKQKFYNELNKMISQNGETLDSAIYRWEYELEAGETIACNGKTYTYDDGIHYLPDADLPILDTKFSVLVDEKYKKDVNNELDKIERELKEEEKFYLTRIDVPHSYKGIYVDIRVGKPDRVEDLTYGWIAKGWATPIVENHPGHNAALEYAKANKMGMWGGNTTENKVHQGQDSTFIELPSERK